MEWEWGLEVGWDITLADKPSREQSKAGKQE